MSVRNVLVSEKLIVNQVIVPYLVWMTDILLWVGYNIDTQMPEPGGLYWHNVKGPEKFKCMFTSIDLN